MKMVYDRNIRDTLMWFHLLVEIAQIYDREKGQLHMCIKKLQAAPWCRHVLRMSLHDVPRLQQDPRKYAYVHQAQCKCTLDDYQEAHRPSQLQSMLKCDSVTIFSPLLFFSHTYPSFLSYFTSYDSRLYMWFLLWLMLYLLSSGICCISTGI